MRRPPEYRSVAKPNGKIDYVALLRETPRLMRPIDYAKLAAIVAIAVGASIANGIPQRGLLVALAIQPSVTSRPLRRAQPLDWIHLGVILALAAGAVLTTGSIRSGLAIALAVSCCLRARRAARR